MLRTKDRTDTFNITEHRHACIDLLNVFMRHYMNHDKDGNITGYDEVSDFVNQILMTLPDDFFIAPCSGTKKNHPVEDNVEPGGLFIHTLKALSVIGRLARSMMFPEELDDKEFSNTMNKDLMAAMIIHDGISRSWDGKKWVTNYSHGKTIFDHVINKIESGEITTSIPSNRLELLLDATRCHMAYWSGDDTEYTIKRSTDMESNTLYRMIKAVQNADMVSSIIEVSFFPVFNDERGGHRYVYDEIVNSKNTPMINLYNSIINQMIEIYENNLISI